MKNHKFNTDEYVKIPAIEEQKELVMYSPRLDEIRWITKEKFLDSFMFCHDELGVFIKASISPDSFKMYDFFLIGEL